MEPGAQQEGFDCDRDHDVLEATSWKHHPFTAMFVHVKNACAQKKRSRCVCELLVTLLRG